MIAPDTPNAIDKPPVLLMTESEAASVLNISKRLLWTLNNQGLIRCIRLGGAKRYTYCELQRYVELELEKATKKRR